MKKKILLVVSMIMLLTASAVLAGGGAKGKAKQLYLYEKDSDWSIVEGGAWGKMSYSENSFVFNGHGLEANTGYTLVRYEGTAWADIECLASGTSVGNANINLKGDIGSYGDKVWLVLTSDVYCEKGEMGIMSAWNPTEYLFENNLI